VGGEAGVCMSRWDVQHGALGEFLFSRCGCGDEADLWRP
jgi:hypothetical protein